MTKNKLINKKNILDEEIEKLINLMGLDLELNVALLRNLCPQV